PPARRPGQASALPPCGSARGAATTRSYQVSAGDGAEFASAGAGGGAAGAVRPELSSRHATCLKYPCSPGVTCARAETGSPVPAPPGGPAMPSRPPALARAPVVPNAFRLRGRVTRLQAEADRSGSVWDVAVAEAADISGSPNFGKSYVGKTLCL